LTVLKNANRALILTGLVLAAGSAEAANGCAPGTFSTTLSPDRNSTSFLFDSLFAISDRTQGPGRTTCSLSAPVTQAKGYSVFSVDYRGFTTKTGDQTVTLDGGKKGDRVRLYNPDGEVAEDYEINRRMGTVDSETLDLSILLTAEGQDGDLDAAQIFLDTLDVSRIGFTTRESVKGSLDGLAEQRRSLLAGVDTVAGRILGLTDPFAGDDYISAFAGTEGMVGFNARWNATDEITLMGGLAGYDARQTGTDADNMLIAAASARYAIPLDDGWKAFGEVGIWGSPDVEAKYTRDYINAGKLVSRTNDASGSLIGGHVRVGVAYAPDTQNEFTAALRLSRSALDVASYAETPDANNLFAAALSGKSTVADTADVTVMWTHALNPTVDYSLFATAGQTFGNSDAVKADVDWVGKATGGWETRRFGSVGARVGWKFHENWAVDTRASLTVAEESKPRWNAGLQLKASF